MENEEALKRQMSKMQSELDLLKSNFDRLNAKVESLKKISSSIASCNKEEKDYLTEESVKNQIKSVVTLDFVNKLYRG